MTHCNDQLIDQLLTQAEQEGRCLIPPSARSEKRSFGAPAARLSRSCRGCLREKRAGMNSTERNAIARLSAPLRSSIPIGPSARFRQLACWGSRSRGGT